MRGLRILFGMLGASLFCFSSTAQVTIRDLGNLGGSIANTFPEGMSSGGDIVVGRSLGPSGWQAFRYDLDTASITGLEHGWGSGISRTRAYDVSTDGSLIVGEYTTAEGYTRCMFWDSLGSYAIPSEYLYYTGAIYGVSDDGRAMALSFPFDAGSSYKIGAQLWRDFGTAEATETVMPLWEPPIAYPPNFLTGSVPFDISADGKVLVGISQTSMARNAVRWVYRSPDGFSSPMWIAHTFEGYPESESSYAYGVSGDGSIVVGLSMQDFSDNELDPDWRWRAFKWSEDGGMRFLQPLPGHDYSEARAISSDGSIIAGTSGPDGPTEAVYWDEDGVHSLAEALGSSLPLTWQLGGVMAVNDIGTRLTGWGTDADGAFAWIITGLYRDSLQDATDVGDGWAESSTYGFFWRAGKSHVWHFEHGWEYVPKGNREFVLVYDYGLREWTWTNDQSYPFLYKFGEEASWMWYAKGCKPGDRWFFHYGKDKWVTEGELRDLGG